MSTIKNLLSEAWDNAVIRYSLILLAVGSAPVYLLSMAKASLVG